MLSESRQTQDAKVISVSQLRESTVTRDDELLHVTHFPCDMPVLRSEPERPINIAIYCC